VAHRDTVTWPNQCWRDWSPGTGRTGRVLFRNNLNTRFHAGCVNGHTISALVWTHGVLWKTKRRLRELPVRMHPLSRMPPSDLRPGNSTKEYGSPSVAPMPGQLTRRVYSVMRNVLHAHDA
jgi:hypothetical protein